jgi:hypothetical protein
MPKLRSATGHGIITLIALCALLAFHFHTCSRHLAVLRPSTTTTAALRTDMARSMRATKPLPAVITTQEDERSLLPKHRLRVLLGIFTADLESEEKMRQRHRDLFALWNDDRVCVLHELQTLSSGQRARCELVYTFVMGANPHATSELVDDSLRPMLVSRPIAGVGHDINDPDILLLNIRENMNDGKSQTWLYHGAQLAERYDLDYVVKCDSDTVLSLHDFFRFAYVNLPPAPYNSNMLVGIPWSKSDWGDSSDRTDETERHFRDHYNGVHIYAAGQLYILSTDLARAVGDEARSLQGKCSYCSPHEDHDVSTMAYHTKRPVKFMMMGYHQIYWQHWVKHDTSGFDRIWEREKARMQGLAFEGQILTTKSRYDHVMT